MQSPVRVTVFYAYFLLTKIHYLIITNRAQNNSLYQARQLQILTSHTLLQTVHRSTEQQPLPITAAAGLTQIHHEYGYYKPRTEQHRQNKKLYATIPYAILCVSVYFPEYSTKIRGYNPCTLTKGGSTSPYRVQYSTLLYSQSVSHYTRPKFQTRDLWMIAASRYGRPRREISAVRVLTVLTLKHIFQKNAIEFEQRATRHE